MSRIKGKNTGPELRLRRALWKDGLRYRISCELPGKPDLVFLSARLAVFVDGCFWHGCPLHAVSPKSNRQFWRVKLKKNIARDRNIDAELIDMGWQVCRFWEHEIENNVQQVVLKIRGLIGAKEI